MTTYKLIYFDLKGLGEMIRLLFGAAGQPFEDKRIAAKYKDDNSFESFPDWPAIKPTFIFGQLPVLEVTDSQTSKTFQIAQSHTIERYLANKFNLAGKNEDEKVHCDMLVEQMIDVMTQIIRTFLTSGVRDFKSAAVQEVYKDKVPPALKYIENILVANKKGNGFLVGDSLTLADLFLINLYDWLRDSKEEILANLPALKQHDEKIRNLPNVAAYLKKSASTRLTPFTPVG